MNFKMGFAKRSKVRSLPAFQKNRFFAPDLKAIFVEKLSLNKVRGAGGWSAASSASVAEVAGTPIELHFPN